MAIIMSIDPLGDFDDCFLSDLDPLLLSELEKSGWSTPHENIDVFLKVAKNIFRRIIDDTENITWLPYEKDEINPNREKQKGVFTLHKNVNEMFPLDLIDEVEISFTKAQKQEAFRILKQKGYYYRALFSYKKNYRLIKKECGFISEKYRNCS